MASFITGLKKSKKHQVTDVTAKQMGLLEDSDETLTPGDLKEDNKQLQQKVEKNEKLIQQLKWEQTEHEHILKVKEQAKRRNVELLAEQKTLVSTGKELAKAAEALFGARVERAKNRTEMLEQETSDTKNECMQLDNDTRKAEEEAVIGEHYFKMDKTLLEGILKQQETELQNMTDKLDRLKAARTKRGRIYNSVEEFMAERAMIIDLAMARGQSIQAKQEDNTNIEKTVNELEKVAAKLQKKLDKLERQ